MVVPQALVCRTDIPFHRVCFEPDAFADERDERDVNIGGCNSVHDYDRIVNCNWVSYVKRVNSIYMPRS
jgi:hypothetical protein